MSISRIDVAHDSDASPLTLTFGTGPDAGDIILLFVSSADGGAGHVKPSGYELLGTVRANSGYGSKLSVYFKVAIGSETTVVAAATGPYIFVSATSIIYRGNGLAVSALLTTSSTAALNSIAAPSLVSVPTGAVSVAAAGLYPNTHSAGTSSTSGSGWAERSDENTDDDAFAGRWNHTTASNSTGTGSVTGSTFTLSTGAGPRTAASFYLYEASTRKSGLMMSM